MNNDRAPRVKWKIRFSKLINQFIYWGIFFYLLLYATEGALRYVLYLHSLEWLIYIRDFFLLAVIVIGFLTGTPQSRVKWLLLGLSSVLVCGSAVGLLVLGNVAQVAYGIKIFLPLLAGFVAGPVIFERPQRTAVCVLVLLGIAAVGVIISASVDVPWLGLSYDLGSVTVEGQRDWAIEGIQRASGFTRASYDAGTQLVIFAVIGTALLRSRALSWAIWLAISPCLYLTTARSPMIAYILVTIYRLCSLFGTRSRMLAQRAAFILPCMVIVFPLLESSNLPGFLQRANLSGVAGIDSLYSRLEYMWPDAFELVERDGSRWFGRGVGGIGSPQELVDPDSANPADNMFIYLWANFGMGGPLMILALAFLLQSVRTGNDLIGVCLFELGLVFFGVGLLLNSVESVGLSLVTGMMIQQAVYRLQFAGGAAPSFGRILAAMKRGRRRLLH